MSFANLDLPILARIRAVLPAGAPAYLVGGAVRDLLLGRTSHDLDFVVPREALVTARKTANVLGGAFYVLDPERDTGRVLLTGESHERYFLDFTSFRGPDLESDLRGRDFTINAIALDLHQPEALIDPLGGAQDLHARVLRLCSPTSFEADPLRILRCVRLAVKYELRLLPETRRLLSQALAGLNRVSPERMRDELFRILEARKPTVALRTLDVLGALEYVLPEVKALKGVTQSPPHVDEVWPHTLNVVQKLNDLIDALGPEHNPEAAANWALGLVALRIGRYRQQISEHLSENLNPDRSLRALLLLAALYHDIGKPASRQVEEDGRIRFFDHDQLGAQLAGQRGARLYLSNSEIERLTTIVRHHMRPLLLAQAGVTPSRRAIYRFFRATGATGVDICLLSLADTLATYGPGLPQEVWIQQLDTVRTLLEAWWEQAEEKVSPPALLNGHDLMESFDLPAGPEIGRLLEELREAQATGEVKERAEAVEFIRACLRND
jgi:putative nucleotidyltransferase with HDIG domain